ncbi:M56 family metallopeptidase [Micromonospora mirobrigensis]|uniref:Signal transducer regulating beta-lactamase production, contains metallopeptidase domain n=1 Tax=Micromonospora mirobrigensis TaxID=262898 RepID=A0A1C4WEH6_9ACTN|nr:M56 family metallopeptidase [Micromonospora mirobrigensis]SCE94331.1 Signal transducer regulating beta-lactamase production, contains metallopeptidase domain [Micromonospora mirobrigensis]
MIIALLVVLASAAAYACCGPWLSRTLRPALAVRLLAPAGLLVTAALWFAAAVTAATWVGQDAEVAAAGAWSAQALRSQAPLPWPVAAVTLTVLAVAVARAGVFLVRRGAAMRAAHRECGRLGEPGALVVLDTDRPDAFTTPEATGRIVVTRGMLRALPADERRALLAHEGSHLAHRHAWWVTVIDLVAATNPTLGTTARSLRNAVERWADEDAAARLGDRRVVARALARAALARHRHDAGPLPAATGGDVPDRVRALLDPPATRRGPALAVLAVVLTLVTLGSATVQHQGERLFERAGTAASPRS